MHYDEWQVGKAGAASVRTAPLRHSGFESVVSVNGLVFRRWRWDTEAEAAAGHPKVVNTIRQVVQDIKDFADQLEGGD